MFSPKKETDNYEGDEYVNQLVLCDHFTMYTCVKTPSSIPQGDGIFIYQFYLHRSWNKKKVDYATKEELELCGDYRVS